MATLAWLFSGPDCLFGPREAISAATPVHAAVSPLSLEKSTVPSGPTALVRGKIPAGATASGLLGQWLGPAQVHELARACKSVFSLTRLRTGRPFVVYGKKGVFESFEYEIDADSRLVVESSQNPEEQFSARIEPIVYEVRTATAEGVIDAHLFQAIDDAGERPALAIMLYNVFAWEVDFVRDLRKGDSFKVLFEKRYREGKFAGYGKVLAAEFTNQGENYRGYRFEHADGHGEFYDEKGRNLRKAFLKAPLDFTRISSRFSRSRLHPVLKIRRPHPGIDYAAPRGTPVKAAGDGVVVKATRSRGAGKYITLRHANGYTSSYLHLSGYRKGIRKGRKVHQGQVIGYVGSTGLSTGPHLDFRMKYNGKWINPARMKNPRAKSLTAEQMARFRTTVRQCTAALGLVTTVAEAGQ